VTGVKKRENIYGREREGGRTGGGGGKTMEEEKKKKPQLSVG